MSTNLDACCLFSKMSISCWTCRSSRLTSLTAEMMALGSVNLPDAAPAPDLPPEPSFFLGGFGATGTSKQVSKVSLNKG